MPGAETAVRPGDGRAVFVGLVAIIAWAPVPLGSNRPWSSALLAAAVGVLVACWALRRVVDGSPLPRAVRARSVALYGLVLWCGLTLAQALPLPVGVLGALAPVSADDYASAALSGAATVPAISVDRASTLQALVRHAAYTGLVLLTLATVSSRRRMRALLVALATIGTAQAAYGLVAHMSVDYLALWRPGVAAGGGVSGTYVNRNHLAGLLALALPAALALLWLELQRTDRRAGLRGRLISGMDLVLGPGVLCAFAALVMTAALILTGSRGGLTASLIGLAVAVALSCAGRVPARSLAARLAAVAVIPVLAVAWLGAAPLVDKLASEGLSSNRGALRAVTYEMIADRPLLGSGAGTYRWVFPAYKDADFGAGFYEHAHNDPLELASEQGLTGLGLVALAVLALLASTARGALVRRDPELRACLFASLAGTLALLAHAMIDFNLHIPANAAIFFVLLALGAAAAGAPRRER